MGEDKADSNAKDTRIKVFLGGQFWVLVLLVIALSCFAGFAVRFLVGREDAKEAEQQQIAAETEESVSLMGMNSKDKRKELAEEHLFVGQSMIYFKDRRTSPHLCFAYYNGPGRTGPALGTVPCKAVEHLLVNRK